jgi:hypothetical protein
MLNQMRFRIVERSCQHAVNDVDSHELTQCMKAVLSVTMEINSLISHDALAKRGACTSEILVNDEALTQARSRALLSTELYYWSED